jgi:hypothetical protein
VAAVTEENQKKKRSHNCLYPGRVSKRAPTDCKSNTLPLEPTWAVKRKV